MGTLKTQFGGINLGLTNVGMALVTNVATNGQGNHPASSQHGAGASERRCPGAPRPYGTTQGSLTTPKFPTTPLLHPTTSGLLDTTTGGPASCRMTQPWFPKLSTPPGWQGPILALMAPLPALTTVRAGYPPLRELNPPALQLTPAAWQNTSGMHCLATELSTLLGWMPALRELNPPLWELCRPARLPSEP